MFCRMLIISIIWFASWVGLFESQCEGGEIMMAMAGQSNKADDTTAVRSAESGRRNVLKHSTSPYLLQHADNPVHWQEWSDEAFRLARKEDKPIFLSIGYSTCHWCHVMAHESFSNAKIAAIMNEHFICIKVDREERPDVDAVYMQAVRVMTGSGGWPLSVFLTPDGEPFFGGTYFPPSDSYGRPGFEKVLLSIADAWENRRSELVGSAGKLRDILAKTSAGMGGGGLSVSLLDGAFGGLSSRYDGVNGGFGGAPKFPQPSNLSMLLWYHYRTGNSDSLKMVEVTLSKMAAGGMYDQVGGGFHRYSTDGVWLVPHFEKMLYDQALLVRSYLQAYQVTGKDEYARIAREVLDYVLRDMRDAGGGFYSAEDADSEGEEGVFYVWGKGEIDKLLGSKDAKVFNSYYGVSGGGNFEDRKNILHVAKTVEAVAGENGLAVSEVMTILQSGRKKLFTVREKRERPHRDEKIIAGWNGLMVSSLALAGRVLGEEKYTAAAERSAGFVLDELISNGRLMRYYGKGKAVGKGVLDDYAFLIMGLLDLYESDFDAKWLIEAKKLCEGMVELFKDESRGGFFLTGDDGEKLLYRDKPAYDGALPSGNSVAAMALLKLGQVTMDRKLSDEGEGVLKAFSKGLVGIGLPEMLMALNYYVGPRQEIVIAGGKDRKDVKEMTGLVGSKFLPRAVVLLHGEDKAIEDVAGFIGLQVMVDGKGTAYVCENYTCKEPVTDIISLQRLLRGLK